MEGKNNKKIKKSKKKTQTLFKTTDMLGLIIITCIISLFAGAFFGTRFLTNEHESETYKVLDQIKDVYVDIKENYYKETNDEDLINGAINGMIAALDDPYATYLTDDNSNSFDAQLQGSYEGIGIEIFNNTDSVSEDFILIPSSPSILNTSPILTLFIPSESCCTFGMKASKSSDCKSTLF